MLLAGEREADASWDDAEPEPETKLQVIRQQKAKQAPFTSLHIEPGNSVHFNVLFADSELSFEWKLRCLIEFGPSDYKQLPIAVVTDPRIFQASDIASARLKQALRTKEKMTDKMDSATGHLKLFLRMGISVAEVTPCPSQIGTYSGASQVQRRF